MNRFVVFACLAAVVLVLPACAYPGGDNPVVRKFTWFDYVEGGDLRRDCAPGAPDRYRFVHNAIYVEQVRSYDVTVAPDGGGTFTARVFGPANLAHVEVARPGDLLSPWRGDVMTVDLSPADMDRVRDAARQSGLTAPPPVGLELHSDRFYWTLAACVGGEYRFTAFIWPSAAFEAATLPEVLASLDPTGVPFSPPRHAQSHDIHPGDPSKPRTQFNLKVGPSGLVGVSALR